MVFDGTGGTMRKGTQHARNADGTITGGKADMYTVDEVIAGLVRANGLISVAARHVGCSESTLRRYIRKYPEVQAAREALKNRLVDLAEGKLLGKINEGNLTAIIFFLKCQAKDRGYIERTTVEHTGQIVTGGPDLTDVDDGALASAVGRLIRGPTSTEGQGDQ